MGRYLLAWVILGWICVEGVAAASFEDKIAAARKGDPVSQYQVAQGYDLGVDVVKSWQRALFWYQKAADQRHPQAEYRLGYLYYRGLGGGKPDYDRALTWFNRAAIHGNAQAMAKLGEMYALGLGVEKDSESSAEWYKRAFAAEVSRVHDVIESAAALGGVDETSAPLEGEESDLSAQTVVAEEVAKPAKSAPKPKLESKPERREPRRRQVKPESGPKPNPVATEQALPIAALSTVKIRSHFPELMATPVVDPVVSDRVPVGDLAELPAVIPDDQKMARVPVVPDSVAQPPVVVAPVPLPSVPLFKPEPLVMVLPQIPPRPKRPPVPPPLSPVNRIGDLLSTRWRSGGQPAPYLPSTINDCQAMPHHLLCWTHERFRRSNDNEYRYKTMNQITELTSGGYFIITYRDLITDLYGINEQQGWRTPEEERQVSGGRMLSPTWEQRSYELRCLLVNNRKIRCSRSNGQLLEFVRDK